MRIVDVPETNCNYTLLRVCCRGSVNLSDLERQRGSKRNPKVASHRTLNGSKTRQNPNIHEKNRHSWKAGILLYVLLLLIN